MMSSYDRMKRLLSLKVELLVIFGGGILLANYLDVERPLSFSWYFVILPIAVCHLAIGIYRLVRRTGNEDV